MDLGESARTGYAGSLVEGLMTNSVGSSTRRDTGIAMVRMAEVHQDRQLRGMVVAGVGGRGSSRCETEGVLRLPMFCQRKIDGVRVEAISRQQSSFTRYQ